MKLQSLFIRVKQIIASRVFMELYTPQYSGGLMHNGTERKIGEQSSNSGRVRYIYLRANHWKKAWIHIISSKLWVKYQQRLDQIALVSNQKVTTAYCKNYSAESVMNRKAAWSLMRASNTKYIIAVGTMNVILHLPVINQLLKKNGRNHLIYEKTKQENSS